MVIICNRWWYIHLRKSRKNRDSKKLKSLGNKVLNQISKNIIKKNNIELVPSKVEAGSGSLPTQNIDSYAISIKSTIKPTVLSQLFRNTSIPVIGYINKGIYFIAVKGGKKKGVEKIVLK